MYPCRACGGTGKLAWNEENVDIELCLKMLRENRDKMWEDLNRLGLLPYYEIPREHWGFSELWEVAIQHLARARRLTSAYEERPENPWA